MKKIIKRILIIICVITLCIVSYQLYGYYKQFKYQDDEDKTLIAEIKQLAEDNESNETDGTFIPDANTYGILHNINSDYRGWILWNNFMISTPLMQESTESSDYYMHHNIYGNYVIGGSAFIDSEANLTDDNLTIYGHSVFLTNTITTGQMLSNLHKLENQSYFDISDNRTFKIYWENEIAEYEVIAVDEINESTTTWNYAWSNFTDESYYNEWISCARKGSLVTPYIDTQYGDKYVTFQTCKYYQGDERIVVVAKEISRNVYETD